MVVIFKDRKVKITDFEFTKYVEDSFISSAYYVDTEVDLDEDELDLLSNENQDIIYNEHWENMLGQADHYADSLKDGSYE